MASCFSLNVSKKGQYKITSYWNTKRLQILPIGEWISQSLKVKVPTKPNFYLVLFSLNWGHNLFWRKSASSWFWLCSYFENFYMQNNHFVLLKTIKGLFLIHLRHLKAYFDLSLILTSKSEVFWQSEQKLKKNIFSHWPLGRLIFILHHSCKNESCYQKSKASNHQISLN